MLRDVQTFGKFFPEELLLELVYNVETSRLRKREFYLWGQGSIPECVRSAARFTSEKLGLVFNFAILKRYRTVDAYESGAYEMHRDPANLTSIPLVLCTLKGEADLVYLSEKGEEVTVRCSANMLTLLKPELTHRITPPLNPEGERHLLFLGYDTSGGSYQAESRCEA